MATETAPQTLGRARRLAFYATVVAVLGLMAAFLGDTLTSLFTGWVGGDPGIHHLHELAFVAVLWTVIVGLLAQLVRPERQVAGILQALFATVVLTGANLLTGFFYPPSVLLGGLVVAAVGLHPARSAVLRWRPAEPSRYLLAMVGLATVPLGWYAIEQALLQTTGDVHAQLGHYADVVTFVAILLALGLLAGCRPAGWRVPLWTAAGMAVLLGAASVVHPTVASSVGPLWGGVAVLWGIGFVAVGALERRNHSP